jgi:hypothetical protein
VNLSKNQHASNIVCRKRSWIKLSHQNIKVQRLVLGTLTAMITLMSILMAFTTIEEGHCSTSIRLLSILPLETQLLNLLLKILSSSTSWQLAMKA